MPEILGAFRGAMVVSIDNVVSPWDDNDVVPYHLFLALGFNDKLISAQWIAAGYKSASRPCFRRYH